MSLMLITSLMAQTEMACLWRQSAGRSLAARGCMRQVPPVELATDPKIVLGAVPTDREIPADQPDGGAPRTARAAPCTAPRARLPTHCPRGPRSRRPTRPARAIADRRQALRNETPASR